MAISVQPHHVLNQCVSPSQTLLEPTPNGTYFIYDSKTKYLYSTNINSSELVLETINYGEYHPLVSDQFIIHWSRQTVIVEKIIGHTQKVTMQLGQQRIIFARLISQNEAIICTRVSIYLVQCETSKVSEILKVPQWISVLLELKITKFQQVENSTQKYILLQFTGSDKSQWQPTNYLLIYNLSSKQFKIIKRDIGVYTLFDENHILVSFFRSNYTKTFCMCRQKVSDILIQNYLNPKEYEVELLDGEQPIDLFISDLYQFVYLITNFGYLHVFDLRSGSFVFKEEIIQNKQPMNTALKPLIANSHELQFSTPRGVITRLIINRQLIVNYVSNHKLPHIAYQLADRLHFTPNLELCSCYLEYLLQMQLWSQATRIIMKSPRQQLRSKETFIRFVEASMHSKADFSPSMHYLAIAAEFGESRLKPYELSELRSIKVKIMQMDEQDGHLKLELEMLQKLVEGNCFDPIQQMKKSQNMTKSAPQKGSSQKVIKQCKDENNVNMTTKQINEKSISTQFQSNNRRQNLNLLKKQIENDVHNNELENNVQKVQNDIQNTEKIVEEMDLEKENCDQMQLTDLQSQELNQQTICESQTCNNIENQTQSTLSINETSDCSNLQQLQKMQIEQQKQLNQLKISQNKMQIQNQKLVNLLKGNAQNMQQLRIGSQSCERVQGLEISKLDLKSRKYIPNSAPQHSFSDSKNIRDFSIFHRKQPIIINKQQNLTNSSILKTNSLGLATPITCKMPSKPKQLKTEQKKYIISKKMVDNHKQSQKINQISDETLKSLVITNNLFSSLVKSHIQSIFNNSKMEKENAKEITKVREVDTEQQ